MRTTYNHPLDRCPHCIARTRFARTFAIMSRCDYERDYERDYEEETTSVLGRCTLPSNDKAHRVILDGLVWEQ